MFVLRKVISRIFLPFIFFLGKKVFVFLLFFILLLSSIVYISYPYIKVSLREENTSKYLRAIDTLYQNKNKTRDDLLNEVKKQSNTNKLSLLLKFLPDLSQTRIDEVKVLEKFVKLSNAVPVVYDFFILKLVDILMEKGDSSCISYLKKITKNHPSYDIAQRKIAQFFLIKKDFKNAEHKISSLEKRKVNVSDLKEMLAFLKKA